MSVVQIKINDEDKNNIKSSIIGLESEKIRKRAYTSFLGLKGLSDYLKSRNIAFTTAGSIANIPLFLNKFDIADLFIEHIRADVRVMIDEKYSQIWIPKQHSEEGICPDIYIAVRINFEINETEILGYIESENISSEKGNQKYIFVDVEDLKPIENLKQDLATIIPNQYYLNDSDHERAEELFLSFLENTIEDDNRNFLLDHLKKCHQCRTAFSQLYYFDKRFSKIDSNNFYSDNLPVENASVEACETSFAIEEEHKNEEDDFSFDFDNNDDNSDKDYTLDLFTSNFPIQGNEVSISIIEEEQEEEEIYYQEDEDDIKLFNEFEKLAENQKDFEVSISLDNDAPESDNYQNEEVGNYIKEEKENFTEEINGSYRPYESHEFEAENGLEEHRQEDFTEETYESPQSYESYEFKTENDSENFDIDFDEPDENNDVSTNETQSKYLENNFGLSSFEEANLNIQENLSESISLNFSTESSSSSYDNYNYAEEDNNNNEKNSEINLDFQEESELIENQDAGNSFKLHLKPNKKILVGITAVVAVGLLTVAGMSVFKNPSVGTAPAGLRPVEVPPPPPGTESGFTMPSAPTTQDVTGVPPQKQEVPSPSELTSQAPHDTANTQPKETNTSKNINSIITNAITDDGEDGHAVKITNICWEVGKSLANNDEFVKYLKLTGQAIKLNLSQDLLNSNDIVASNRVKIGLIIDKKDGSIVESRIKVSSGSKQIDDIILTTIKNTLNYIKLPEITTKKNSIDADIVIYL